MGFLKKIKENRKKKKVWSALSSEKKEKALKDALNYLQYDPDTADLLEQAMEDGIEISFSPVLLDTYTGGSFDSYRRKINLKPDLSFSQDAAWGSALTLAHELRHYWQYKTLGLLGKKNSSHFKDARLCFIFNRVVESDAWSFRDQFASRVVKTVEHINKGLEQKIADLKEKNPKVISFSMPGISFDSKEEQEKKCKAFKDYLSSKKEIMPIYDIKTAKYLLGGAHYLRTKKLSRNINGSKEMISNLKTLIRPGIDMTKEDSCFKNLSDYQFTKMVLKDAHKGSLKVVSLIESFSKATEKSEYERMKTYAKAAKKYARKLPEIKY